MHRDTARLCGYLPRWCGDSETARQLGCGLLGIDTPKAENDAYCGDSPDQQPHGSDSEYPHHDSYSSRSVGWMGANCPHTFRTQLGPHSRRAERGDRAVEEPGGYSAAAVFRSTNGAKKFTRMSAGLSFSTSNPV